MKKLTAFLSLLALLGTGRPSQAQTTTPAKMAHLESSHLMMHDGKMMMEKNGDLKPMTKTMTLANGSKVMADGTVMTKDGQKMMLKDDEMIGMDGKMHDGSGLHTHLDHGAKKGMMKTKM